MVCPVRHGGPEVRQRDEVACEGHVDEAGDPCQLGGVGGGVFVADGDVCSGEGVRDEAVEGEGLLGHGEEVALVLGGSEVGEKEEQEGEENGGAE